MLGAVVAAPFLPAPAPTVYGIDWASGADYTTAFFARKFQIEEIARIFNVPAHLLREP